MNAGSNAESRKGRAMRIVYWGTYDPGKPRNRILLRGLRENGVDVIEIHADVWKGIEDKSSIRSPGSRLRRPLRWLASYPRLLIAYGSAPAHDAVVVGYPGYLDVLMIWPLARLKRRPVVWDAFMSLYGTVVEDRRMLRKGSVSAKLVHLFEWLACRAATTVVLDTDEHARYFVERYGLNADRVARIFVGAEPEAFLPGASAPGFNERPLVLFYGQFIPLHGIDTIVRAAMSKEGAEFDWILIGRGQEEAGIRRLLGDRLPGNIEWIPWVDYQELRTYMHKADLCLGIFGDSIKTDMVIPNKVYEYAAIKKCIITKDTPAIKEIFEDGKHMVLTDSAPEAIAAKIQEMKQDPNRRQSIAEEGYKVVTSEYDEAGIARKFVAIAKQCKAAGTA